MRYFVTGGAGFIGSNYVEHLFNDVKELTGVTIYDNLHMLRTQKITEIS